MSKSHEMEIGDNFDRSEFCARLDNMGVQWEPTDNPTVLLVHGFDQDWCESVLWAVRFPEKPAPKVIKWKNPRFVSPLHPAMQAAMSAKLTQDGIKHTLVKDSGIDVYGKSQSVGEWMRHYGFRSYV